MLLQRNHRSSESSIKSFLSTGVVELLANGTFCLKDGLVRAVTPSSLHYWTATNRLVTTFNSRIAQGWGVTDVRDGAIHRIHELALDRARRARIAGDDVASANRIVGTYFIVDIPNVRHEITKQVMAQLGGAVWNL